MNGNGTYFCNCTRGWLGKDCSDVDFCFKQNCSEHGACHITRRAPASLYSPEAVVGPPRQPHKHVLRTVQNGTGYACDCTPGFTGINCENTYCTGRNCSGNGVCINGNAASSCNCNPGYVGSACQDTYCTNQACSNRGRCANGAKGFTCHCGRGFFGKTCSMHAWYGALFGVTAVVFFVLFVLWWRKRFQERDDVARENNARLLDYHNSIYEEMSAASSHYEHFRGPPPSRGSASGTAAWRCPLCSTLVPANHNFCTSCGASRSMHIQ